MGSRPPNDCDLRYAGYRALPGRRVPVAVDWLPLTVDAAEHLRYVDPHINGVSAILQTHGCNLEASPVCEVTAHRSLQDLEAAAGTWFEAVRVGAVAPRHGIGT